MVSRRARFVMFALATLSSVPAPLTARPPAAAQQPVPAPPPSAQSAPAQPGPEQQVPTPSFRTGVDLVAVDVSIVNDRGDPVRGLKPEDFQLSVDGQPRTIVSAEFVSQTADSGPPRSEQYSTNEGAAGGRLIMLVIDQGSIRRSGGGPFIRTASRLLDNLGPGDRVGLAVIPGGRVLDFTGHLALVRAQLERIVGGAPRFVGATNIGQVGVAEALAYDRGEAGVWAEIVARECPLTLSRSETIDNAKVCADNLAADAVNLASQVRQQTQNSLLALQRLMADVARLPRPKTLLLLSEGMYLDRDLSQVSWVAGQAAASRVSVYGIVLDDPFADIDTSQQRSSPTRMADRQLRLDGLHTLTGLARGTAYEVIAGADSAFDRIARELTGYYLVAFEPLPAERDGRKHDISIKVRRSGVEVRARREFTVDRASAAARTDEDLLAESLRDPLLATERRMRVATYALPDPQSANVRLLISAGLGLPADELAIRSVAFKLTDGEGNVVASRIDKAPQRTDRDHRYLGTVVVPPGSYTLKIAGVDEEGHRGSVEHLLDASLSKAGALAVSELVLGQVLAPGDGALRPAIEPEVTEVAASAYLELHSTEAARLADAAVRVEVAATPNAPALIKADAIVSPTTSPERKLVLGEIALDDLAPGAYVARAVVQLGGDPVARILRPFRYAPRSGTRRASVGWRPGSRAFDRSLVLRPEVVGPLLDGMTPPAEASVASAIRAARDAIGGGRFEQVNGLLGPAGADASASVLRGMALYAQGKIEPAAAEFRQAIAAGADTPVAATFYLGACYAAGGRDSEAVGAWQMALASGDEAPPMIYPLLADAHLRLRDPVGAAATAREALGADPENDEVRLQLVEALTLAGNAFEALEALDPFLARHPADVDRLFGAMRLLHQAQAAGEWPEPREKALQRFERYFKAYVAGRGKDQALAAHWRDGLRQQ